MNWSYLLPGALAVGLSAVAATAFAPVFIAGALAVPLTLALVPVVLTDVAAQHKPAFARWRAPVAIVEALFLLAEVLLRGSTRAGLPTVETGRRLWSGAVNSWARTLDTTWPVPADPDLLLFVPLLALLSAVTSVELLRRVAPLPALLPPLALLVLAQAFAAREGSSAWLLAVLFAAGSVLLLLTSREAATSIALPALTLRSLVLLTVMCLAAPAVAAADPLDREPYSLKDRREAQVLPATVVSPLDDVSARLADPDRVMFRARTDAAIDTWTLAFLDDFDGSTWSVRSAFVPLGSTLEADPGVTTPTADDRASIAIQELDGPFLPSASRTVSVRGPRVAVDPESGVLVTGRELEGLRYAVTWRRPVVEALDLTTPLVGSASSVGRVPPEIDELAARLRVPGPPTLQTALRLEQYLRDNYRRADKPPLPSGSSYPQLIDFLIDSKSGTSEQFAASYVVLARAMGMPTRLAVGFRNPQDREGDAYVVRNRDAFVWPEVNVADVGWVPLDPTSSTIGGRAKERRDVAAATDGARDQLEEQPDAPAGEQGDPTPPTSSPDGPPDQSSPLLTLYVALASGLLLACAIPLAKSVRAHRRRHRTPVGSVIGAWHEARDRLADAGFPVASGTTPLELARAAGARADTAAALGLASIARCLDKALWSGVHPSTDVAVEAWQGVRLVRRDLRRLPVLVRLRACVDPRSLRPGRHQQTSARRDTRLLSKTFVPSLPRTSRQ